MKKLLIFVLILIACIEVLACNLEQSLSTKGKSAIQKETSLKALSKNYFKLGCGLTGRSESTNAIYSPLANSIPVFLAADKPPLIL